jgi:hypothetical protein
MYYLIPKHSEQLEKFILILDVQYHNLNILLTYISKTKETTPRK